MTGHMSYIGKDKVQPVNKFFSYLTTATMVTTGLFVLIFTVF